MSGISRKFVSVGARQVHFRYAGNGPALLLIHQSPQNSRMWLQMIERFADRYTVIAPDTPGFGYSDALEGNPMTIAEFGAATLEFADALGLQRFAVFGMHTGGLIATWLAWANPQRVAALVVDGYAAFTPQESAQYGEAYLPPFVPMWDGSHLRWLWSRMREQKYFFPWYDGRAEAAMLIAPQTIDSTREAVMDVLDVGDTYRAGYAAAFRHNDHHWVSELQMPAWMVFRHGDPLLAHMPRLQNLPANVVLVEERNGIPAMQANMEQWLGAALADEAGFNMPAATATAGNGWSRHIVATPAGDIASWHRPGEGVLQVRLHAPGTRPATPAQIDPGTAAWLLPDVPGHGASSEMDAALDVATMVGALRAAIDSVPGSLPIVLEAHGAAAGYVPALVEALGSRIREVILHAPWLLTADEQALLLAGLPTTVVDRAGGYLCDAWQWERERHLLWPWMAPGAAARRRVDAPAPAHVHDNVVELLRLSGRLHELLRDATPADLAQRLRALPVPLRVVADSQSDYQGRAAALLA
ncbi:MAG: alpha/beta fold hydrolase [Stenotrophomonas sp.]